MLAACWLALGWVAFLVCSGSEWARRSCHECRGNSRQSSSGEDLAQHFAGLIRGRTRWLSLEKAPGAVEIVQAGGSVQDVERVLKPATRRRWCVDHLRTLSAVTSAGPSSSCFYESKCAGSRVCSAVAVLEVARRRLAQTAADALSPSHGPAEQEANSRAAHALRRGGNHSSPTRPILEACRRQRGPIR
jgi:hypothetical protein